MKTLASRISRFLVKPSFLVQSSSLAPPRNGFRRSLCDARSADISLREVRLIELHEDMKVGKVTAWTAKIGDKIQSGDTLCEIETEQAFVEIEAQQDGFLAEIIQPVSDDAIKVGELLATLVNTAEDVTKVQQRDREVQDREKENLKEHEKWSLFMGQWHPKDD